jgi:hypothetical protein
VLYRAAYAAALNDFALSVDGGAAVTDASGTMPTVTTVGAGFVPGSSIQANAVVQVIAIANRRVSDANLVLATTP